MSDDLKHVEELLRERRPRLSPLELDAVRSRIGARAGTPAAGPRSGGIMRTRLAITAVLAVGLVTSSAGAGLAVSGISGDGSSGEAQYPQATVPEEGPPPEVLGEQDTGGGNNPDERGNPAQPVEQVSVGDDDDLPFTGLASIPILLAGIGLIGFGIVLRRGARSEPAH